MYLWKKKLQLVIFFILVQIRMYATTSEDTSGVCFMDHIALSSIPNQEIIGSVLHYHEDGLVSVNCTAGPASSGDVNTFLNWSRFDNGSLMPFVNAVQNTLPDFHWKPICDIQQLYINRVTKKDEGVYVCSRMTKTRNFTLKVYNTSQPVVSLNTLSNITVKEGSILTVSCNVSGSPLPVVQWKNSTNILKECFQKQKCLLTITTSENSTLTCSAVNKYGNDSATLYVNVVVPPELVKRPHTGIFNNKLECSVIRAVPLPFFLWQFKRCNQEMRECETTWNNVDVKQNEISPPSNLATRHSRLVIHSKANVYGLYRCVAENIAGNSTSTMQVSIQQGDSQVELVAGAVSAVTFFVVVIGIIGVALRRKLMKKQDRFFSLADYQVRTDIDLIEQCAHLPYNTHYEYPRNKLEFIKILGSGAFGQVWLARALNLQHVNQINLKTGKRKNSFHELLKKSSKNNNKSSYHSFVAVKTLKDDASEVEYKDLASEIKILIHIGKHENIVNLLGACTKGGSLFAIIEYCPYGDMKGFLRTKRDIFTSCWDLTNSEMYTREFTLADLVFMAHQIACGMAFLHSQKLIHRDLACRNILLGNEYCIKISDFGLARDVYKGDCYVKTTSGMLPVKWMSPESLFDKIYNTKTDVWSFSIVLWEIFTLGGSPYPSIPTEDLFVYLKRGRRMKKPDPCPADCYELMSACWSEIPDQRPEFCNIVSSMDSILKSNLTIESYDLMCRSRNALLSTNSNLYVQTPPVKKSKKFSFSNFFSPSKKSRTSTTEQQLLSRLSSTNSDVFEK